MLKIPNNNRGFTMIEVIIAVVIIAILSTIAVPLVINFNGKAKNQVCDTNRDTILRMYQIYCVSNSDCSLEEYFLLNENDIINSAICPSGGIYSPTGAGIAAEIICSVHDEGETPDPVGVTIPGTNVEVNSTWPADEEFRDTNGYPKTVWLQQGQTYFHDGNYYVVAGNVDLYKSTGYPTPTNGWWYNNNAIGVIRISEKRWNFTGSTTEEFQSMTGVASGSVNKGDVCIWQGRTFIFTNATYGWVAPPQNNSHWVEIKSHL